MPGAGPGKNGVGRGGFQKGGYQKGGPKGIPRKFVLIYYVYSCVFN